MNFVARGAGFVLHSKPRLVVKVYDFLSSKGVACLRDVYVALGEEPSRVDNCLRRLRKKKNKEKE